MRARLRLGVLLAAAIASAPGAALAGPSLLASVGGTGAVDQIDANTGVSSALSLLVPVGGGVSFGPTVFADDLGNPITRLKDPNDGTDLGAVAGRHYWSYGAGWRADLAFPRGGWIPSTSLAWTINRIESDVRGRERIAISSVGLDLGGAVRRRLTPLFALGVSARYHMLFNDDLGHYATASVDAEWGGSR